MPRPRLGAKPMTPTERSARRRQQQAAREDELRAAMRLAMAAKTIREARAILAATLGETESH